MLYFTGYKSYPTYVSPLADRIRKRKAFADSELDSSSHLFMMPAQFSSDASQPCVNHLSRAVSSATLTMHLANAIESNNPTQTTMNWSNEIDNVSIRGDYSPPQPMKMYRSNQENLAHNRIRIIDDAKLYETINSQRMADESFISVQSTLDSADGAEIKPKLSFSIESIIGMK